MMGRLGEADSGVPWIISSSELESVSDVELSSEPLEVSLLSDSLSLACVSFRTGGLTTMGSSMVGGDRVSSLGATWNRGVTFARVVVMASSSDSISSKVGDCRPGEGGGLST